MAIFLDDVEPRIAECLRDVRERIKYLGVTACSTREFADALRLHQQLREIERLVARAADDAIDRAEHINRTEEEGLTL